jgi:hypothetical protein
VAVNRLGILRLRGWSASRTSRSAQDDSSEVVVRSKKLVARS